jgi:hypothetical protein
MNLFDSDDEQPKEFEFDPDRPPLNEKDRQKQLK